MLGSVDRSGGSMNKNLSMICLLLALCGFSSLAPADAQSQQGRKLPPDPTEDPLMLSAGFLAAHPDLRYRLLGLEEMKQERHEEALRFFMRAGYYSDKPSQGMVAEMLWNGQGSERDPAMAYIWMDLAAERGYEGFLVLRERYWARLDEAQRQRALEQGPQLYAKYGDAAAQPRLEVAIRRGRNKMTGSRLGSVGNLQIYVPGPAGYDRIDGTQFYDERYWDPKQYRAWHDAIWMKPRVGKVSVGELESLREAAEASRIPAAPPVVDSPEPSVPERDELGLGTKKEE